MHASLIVSVQSNSSVAKYRQIAEQISGQISDGTLLPGDRLPPIRILSEQLSVNSATIVKAYESLQKQSLVTKIHGSGVYVGSDPIQRPERQVRSEFDDDELYLDDEIDLMQKGTIVIGDDAINFATSTPTSDMFPVARSRRRSIRCSIVTGVVLSSMMRVTGTCRSGRVSVPCSTRSMRSGVLLSVYRSSREHSRGSI